MSEQITRADSDTDPERCQSVTARGQCDNKVMPGSDYCKAHGGIDKDAIASLRNYRLGQVLGRRLLDKTSSEDSKSLRDEIGILRIVMETVLNKCEDENDLMIQSAKISDLASKIQLLVSSCHKLEGAMGQHLDKQAILQFAGAIIGVIGNHIKDSDLLNQIADEILECIPK